MYILKMYVDSNSFGMKYAEAVAAVRSALKIFNQKILHEQCGIDGFALVETDDDANADVIICEKHRTDLELHGNLSVELLPSISETDGKTIFLDTVEIADVSSSYDKPFDDIVCEAVCHELCLILGVSGRIGQNRYGSKEYQQDFGLMLKPYNVYNSNLSKEYYLTDSEIAALKASVSSIVAQLNI